MKGILFITFLMVVLGLSSCGRHGDASEEELRIRQAVEQRVEAMRTEMKISESRWHTVRIVAFSLLAGGSLIWLFNGDHSASSRRNHPMLGDGSNPDPGYRRRVIDRNYDDDEPDEHPYRR